METLERMWSTKTFWVGLATIIYAGISYYNGSLDPNKAIEIALAGLAIITGRDAITKITQ